MALPLACGLQLRGRDVLLLRRQAPPSLFALARSSRVSLPRCSIQAAPPFLPTCSSQIQRGLRADAGASPATASAVRSGSMAARSTLICLGSGPEEAWWRPWHACPLLQTVRWPGEGVAQRWPGLGSRSSMVEQEEAGEDWGHEASKIQAPASARGGHHLPQGMNKRIDVLVVRWQPYLI